jgi:hypothetical protein
LPVILCLSHLAQGEVVVDTRKKKSRSRNKKKGADYSIFCHDHIVSFEFILPLTNEGQLRSALDALFYKDSVMNRLESIAITDLEKYFGNYKDENRGIFFENICDWISHKFTGYSISHVSGRYRAEDLCLLKDAHHFITNGGNYLVDETTAVVKFIFPLGESHQLNDFSFESELEDSNINGSSDILKEYAKIRLLFFKLFVQNIIEVVSEEDEIWMMESGLRHRLYSWRVV